MCLEAATPLGFTGLLKDADAGSIFLVRHWSLLGPPLRLFGHSEPSRIKHQEDTRAHSPLGLDLQHKRVARARVDKRGDWSVT